MGYHIDQRHPLAPPGAEPLPSSTRHRAIISRHGVHEERYLLCSMIRCIHHDNAYVRARTMVVDRFAGTLIVCGFLD